jgi:putative tricarboxylic transport membrane protein
MTRRTDQVTGLALLAFAVGYVAVAFRSYPYRSDTGPGSGFLPVWLGIAMAVLALLLVVRASRAGAAGDRWLPAGKGLVRLLVVVAAAALFVALMDVVGMVLGSALFLLGLLRFLERYPWPWAIGIAAGVALANYAVFTYWLRVPFPTSLLGV